MDSWFDDPFFQTSGNPDRDIRNHFDQMNRQMSKMMESMDHMMRNFGGIGFDDDMFGARPALEDNTRGTRSNRNDSRNDYNYSHSSGKSGKKQPIVEEPDDYGNYDTTRGSRFNPSSSSSNSRSGQPKTYVYSSSMSTFMGPDGVQHSKKKTYDSSTGKTEMAEMRKLGNQAVAMKREIDRDGHVTEQMDRKNLNEDELNDFSHRWSSTTHDMHMTSFGLTDQSGRNGHHHHNHRALK